MGQGHLEEGFLFYLFFPVMIFPSLILYTESNGGMMILICQTITLFPIWGLSYVLVFVYRKEKQDGSKAPPNPLPFL
jgi:positive regulator of sigma E activity